MWFKRGYTIYNREFSGKNLNTSNFNTRWFNWFWATVLYDDVFPFERIFSNKSRHKKLRFTKVNQGFIILTKLHNINYSWLKWNLDLYETAQLLDRMLKGTIKNKKRQYLSDVCYRCYHKNISLWEFARIVCLYVCWYIASYPNSSKKMGGLSLFLICPRQSVYCQSKRQHLYIIKTFKFSEILALNLQIIRHGNGQWGIEHFRC